MKKMTKKEKLVQVLSETVEEVHSESAIKVKDPRVVLKDLNLPTKSILCPSGIIPCTVGLERYDKEKIQLLASPKETNISWEAVETCQGNINADELVPEDVRSSDSNKSSIFAKSTPTFEVEGFFTSQYSPETNAEPSTSAKKSPRSNTSNKTYQCDLEVDVHTSRCEDTVNDVKSTQPDYSNITLRKRSNWKNMESSMLQNISPTCSNEGTFKITKMDNFKILPSSFGEAEATPSTTAASLSKQMQKFATLEDGIIEISEESEEESVSATTSESSGAEKYLSVIIVDDSPRCDDSPVRNASSTVVRTNLPSVDEDSSQLNKPLTNSIGRKPMQLQSHIDSPWFNKRGTVGRSPLWLKLTAEDDQVSYSLPKMNKRISSGERVRLQNDSLASPVVEKNNNNIASKKSTLPVFASMFDKMVNLEEHAKHKEKRAKLLLSSSKQVKRNSGKKISSKKQLNYEKPSTSAALPKKRKARKALLVFSTPKPETNQKNGYTRYGFKIDRGSTKKKELIAVANKIKPHKSTTAFTAENKSVIKGVRSNRRFDLLMKIRQKRQE